MIVEECCKTKLVLKKCLIMHCFPIKEWELRDIPSCPVVKTLLPSAGGAGSIPGWGAKNPHAWWPKTKTWNGNNIVTNSIKTKSGPHQKKKKEREFTRQGILL